MSAAVVLLCLVFFPPFSASAAEKPGVAAIKKELQTDIGMPILAGDLWDKMSHDDKVAFVWGFWHVVSIERYIMDKYPQLRTENFAAKVVEASQKRPESANAIVAMIDSYYQSHPEDIKKPAVGVIWDEMVKPNISTGIAGRPLR
jgi:hypothetical protein